MTDYDDQSEEPHGVQTQRNIGNILELARFMETELRLRFDMGTPTQVGQKPSWCKHECGTAGCIGGFAAALWKECAKKCTIRDEVFVFSDLKLAQRLRISNSVLERLCYPGESLEYWDGEEDEGETIEYSKITRAGAITTLKRFAESGRVEWRLEDQTQAPPQSNPMPTETSDSGDSSV